MPDLAHKLVARLLHEEDEDSATVGCASCCREIDKDDAKLDPNSGEWFCQRCCDDWAEELIQRRHHERSRFEPGPGRRYDGEGS